MRLFLALVLLVSIVFLPQSGFSATATTIDELAAMYSIEACIDCHEETHDEWKSSWHSQSLVDSLVIRGWRTFIKRGLDKEEMLGRKDLKGTCLPCHVPQIKDASDDVGKQIADLVVTAADDKKEAKRKAAKKELSKLNINCLSCHNLRATPDGNPEPNTIYGPRGADEIDASHHEEAGFKTVKSDFIKDSKFCAQCHHGCPPGMPSSVCPTIYTSYMEDYVGKGGKETCQGCHMKGEEIKSHRFPGIYEVDFVKEGVSLTVNARPTTYFYSLENKIVPAVVVQVDLINKAGHGIPRG